MVKKVEKYCPKCGYKINPDEDRFCVGCGKPIIWQEEPAPLSEADVKDIPIEDKPPLEVLKPKPKNKGFWLIGSYYLAVVVNSLTLILVIMRIVNPEFLPLVITITLLAISLFGATQIRPDLANQKFSFLKLMFLSFKKFLSFLNEVDKPKKPDKPAGK